jgi:alpha-mannosidase
LVEIDDPSVVVSAIEPRPDRRTVLRLYNTSAQPRTVTIRWNGLGARALEHVDLMERTVGDRSVSAEAARATLSLRPWEIATLRTR